MKRLRALLAWFRIQDEAGQLSLTTIAFAVGVYCILHGRPISLAEWSAFALALAGYHAKKIITHREALAKRSDDAESLLAKLTAIEGKVKELATPERMEALRGMLRK